MWCTSCRRSDGMSTMWRTNDRTSQNSTTRCRAKQSDGGARLFGILVLIPILAAKESKFARFHANQGLILLITGVAYSIFVQVVIKIVAFISYALAGIVGIALGLAWLLLLVLAIIGIINAVKGEFKQLPLIGQFQILK